MTALQGLQSTHRSRFVPVRLEIGQEKAHLIKKNINPKDHPATTVEKRTMDVCRTPCTKYKNALFHAVAGGDTMIISQVVCFENLFWVNLGAGMFFCSNSHT